MNIEELITDLRARVNLQYYDQIGTESYERQQCVDAMEYLARENERLKELMAKRAREHQQEMTSYRLRVKSQDDATFAALREENERLRENAKTISELEQLAARSNNDLLVENERLRNDAERLDWMDETSCRHGGTDMNLIHGRVTVYVRTGIGSQIHRSGNGTAREAIDAARGAT